MCQSSTAFHISVFALTCCRNDLYVNVLPAPNRLIHSMGVVRSLADVASCFRPSPPSPSQSWFHSSLRGSWECHFAWRLSVILDGYEKENLHCSLILPCCFFFSLLFILCLSGPSSYGFSSLKCSLCQRPRQPREMILQWMWTSPLL